jgi:hemerythrin-like metal-binding protein
MQKPFVAWTSKMSVGVDALDDDHKCLLGILNDLHDGITAGRGTERLGKVLNGLVSYTGPHFAREEELFVQTGYPDSAEHIKEHQALSSQILDMHVRYNKGLFDGLSLEALVFLNEWVNDHIQVSDKKYKAHLNASGIH